MLQLALGTHFDEQYSNLTILSQRDELEQKT
jgi:hypothetical protein